MEINNSNEPINEQTLAERYETQELATVQVYGRIGKILSKMKNLSASGGFFEMVQGDALPQKGDIVKITVNLRQLGKTHYLDGEVVWYRGLGIGVHFLKKDQVVTKMLSRITSHPLT